MDARDKPPVAEMSGFDALTFEQQLEGQAFFIGALYGSAFLIGLCVLIGFTLRIQRNPLSWRTALDVLAARPWNITHAVIIILPLITAQFLFYLAMYFFRGVVNYEEGQTEKVFLILQSLLFHWICFVLIVLSLGRRKLAWSDAFGMRSQGVSRELFTGILIILGVMPLLIGYNFVARMIMDWIGYAPEVQDVTRIISDASGWPAKIYFALLAIVVAPVVEELLFRGVLLPAISRITGVRMAILLVSLLFAAVHGMFLPQSVIFFILSVAFSLAYIYRQTIIAPIAMHAFFNGMTIAVIMRL